MGRILPGALAQKWLSSAYGGRIGTVRGQDHRFHRFALEIRELAAQIEGRPLPLFTALKQIMKLLVIGDEFLRHRFDIARG
jgi:hypothetical protein